jgi:hypothetical protein
MPALPEPTTPVADATDPTPLRWGLDDVLLGDDDSVIVLLSGPQGEPYWLELEPDRAAALRRNLENTEPATADAVLDVLPEPVDRAAVRAETLREAADLLQAWRPEFFERWAIAEQDRYEDGVNDAADHLRRLAGEHRGGRR